ncbi:hypothetical protein HK096_011224, partial [Nowakowskiella sp. JEL0078]
NGDVCPGSGDATSDEFKDLNNSSDSDSDSDFDADSQSPKNLLASTPVRKKDSKTSKSIYRNSESLSLSGQFGNLSTLSR